MGEVLSTNSSSTYILPVILPNSTFHFHLFSSALGAESRRLPTSKNWDASARTTYKISGVYIGRQPMFNTRDSPHRPQQSVASWSK